MTTERHQRHERILACLRERGRARIADLCVDLRASGATIRRDLDDLGACGLLKRTHGGAILSGASMPEPRVLQRFDDRAAEKRLIAQMAVTRIADDDTVFLGSGSTVLHMLPFLKEKRGLTVVTNSLPVINALAASSECRTVLVGGLLRDSELSLVGHVSVRTLEELRADKVFVGAEAIHPDHGITNSDLEDTMTDRAIVGISPQIILLADHRKFNKIHASFLGPLEMVQLIITDPGADARTIGRLVATGVQVLIA